MATAYQFFSELAARYGGVDRADQDAVIAFYKEGLETLPVTRIEAILEELLECEMESNTEEIEPWCPAPVALPRLRHSPSLPPPFWLGGWRRLMGRSP
jgi:hypothetical protein